MRTKNSKTPFKPLWVMALSSGDLVRRLGSPCVTVRTNYCYHHKVIATSHDLRATLRAGRFTSLGSYPLFLYTSDGAALCFECAAKEYRQVSTEIREHSNCGFRVVGTEINYEDEDLTCDHCNKPIESAYGDPDATEET